MASPEEKLKDKSRDRQVMGSNANGAEGAEGKVEETHKVRSKATPREVLGFC
jgi:hypothetical protein